MPDSRGQGIVEFALVLPVMILILLVAVDFGRLAFTYVQVNNAAREAASLASQNIGYGADVLRDRVEHEANLQAQGGKSLLIVDTPTCAAAAVPRTPGTCPVNVDAAYLAGAGHLVTVAVSRPFTFLTPMIGVFFPPQMDRRSLSLGDVSRHAGGNGRRWGRPARAPTPAIPSPPSLSAKPARTRMCTSTWLTPTPTAGTCPHHITSYRWSFDDGAAFGTARTSPSINTHWFNGSAEWDKDHIVTLKITLEERQCRHVLPDRDNAEPLT